MDHPLLGTDLQNIRFDGMYLAVFPVFPERVNRDLSKNIFY